MGQDGTKYDLMAVAPKTKAREAKSEAIKKAKQPLEAEPFKEMQN